MVASPDLGICSDCGEEFSVLPTVADVGVSHLPEAA
jgi:hypothetical protein